jgi:ribosomal protein L37AE/L43A
MMTREEQQSMRRAAMDESGTEPPCPFCGKPRVSRSSYIRCNGCGVNWLAEEMHLPDYLNLDPRVARSRSAHTVSSTRPIAERPAADAE